MKKLLLLLMFIAAASCGVDMADDSSDKEDSTFSSEPAQSHAVAPIDIQGCSWGCTGSDGQTQSFWCSGDAGCCARHQDACESASPL